MDINYIENLNFSIIFCTCDSFNINKEVPKGNPLLFPPENDIDFKIQKRNPADVIKSYDKAYIEKYVWAYLRENQKNIFQTNSISSMYTLPRFIEEDILLLMREKQLTSKLAMLIYRISTLEFNASSTKIGTYYRKVFKVKSKTIRHPYLQKIILKAYDLNEFLI